MTAFEQDLRALVRDEVRAAVREALAEGVPGYVDQSRSTLGVRRHIALARKLIAAGSTDAQHIGRRYLVRREAVEAHAAELSRAPRRAKAAPVDDLATVRARYGLRRAS